MRVSKLLGLAGIAGVAAATGVVLVQRRRRWTETAPEELRARLHARLEGSTQTDTSS